jgi:hypothetical protein
MYLQFRSRSSFRQTQQHINRAGEIAALVNELHKLQFAELNLKPTGGPRSVQELHSHFPTKIRLSGMMNGMQ